MYPSSKELAALHNIAKNLDYSLRVKAIKSILVTSDCEREGKSTFIKECAPLLCDLYKRKVLVFDCQLEKNDLLEKSLSTKDVNHQFIRETSVSGLDYIHSDDLFFLETLPRPEKVTSLVAYFNEVSRVYDVVLINMKTLRRADKTTFPALPIDSAIIVRSRKSIGKKKKLMTEELLDREIPILGLMLNEGI